MVFEPEFTNPVCQRCGAASTYEAARAAGWLMARRASNLDHLVVRCPSCITSHALRLAGLPDRISTKRVEKLAPVGLHVRADGFKWFAWQPEGVGPYMLQALPIQEPVIGLGSEEWFTSLAGLVMAMSMVEDLRLWKSWPD